MQIDPAVCAAAERGLTAASRSGDSVLTTRADVDRVPSGDALVSALGAARDVVVLIQGVLVDVAGAVAAGVADAVAADELGVSRAGPR